MKKSELRKIIREEFLREGWEEQRAVQLTSTDSKELAERVSSIFKSVGFYKTMSSKRAPLLRKAGYKSPVDEIAKAEKYLGEAKKILVKIYNEAGQHYKKMQ